MTMPKNVILFLLVLVIGKPICSMQENNSKAFLTESQAERVKNEVAMHVKRENGRFHVIPKDVVVFMISYSDVYNAFVARKVPIKHPDTAESLAEQFNKIVDSYVQK